LSLEIIESGGVVSLSFGELSKLGYRPKEQGWFTHGIEEQCMLCESHVWLIWYS